MMVVCCEKVFWLLLVLTTAAKIMFFPCSLLAYGLGKHDRDRKRDKEWNRAEGKSKLLGTAGPNKTADDIPRLSVS